MAGTLDQPLASEHGGVKIEIVVQPGITPAVPPSKPGAPSIAARLAEESIRKQKEIEAAERVDFETYRQKYLSPESLNV